MPPDKISLNDLDKAPIDLPIAANTDWETKFYALNEKFTQTSDDNFRLKEENSSLRSASATRGALDDLINPYAHRVFLFMCIYCAFVAIVIVYKGLRLKGFDIDNEVLKFLVGSTAVTVIGLVGMVLTGVFVGARKSS